MSDAREEILRRVRTALADVPGDEQPSDVVVTRAYRRSGALTACELLDRLEERLRDYHADTRRVAPGAVAAAVASACSELGLGRLAVAPGLPAQWLPDAIELVFDQGLAPAELDRINAALTGCAVAVAETGTIVLDGGGSSGRRALTLVPDHHICIVDAAQVVELVPEALARLAPAVVDQRMPITLVSGPSATSDIELTRVEGVHGPRRLVVLIVGSEEAGG